MRESDFDEFGQMLDAVCSLLSRGAYKPNAQNTALFFRAMARYELADVRAALDAHVADSARGRFVPVPADLIAQIEAAAVDDGRPGAEEAWAIAVRSSDERNTVVWTEEIAQAFAIARPILQLGDEVGARMAFKDAYGRLVTQARQAGRPAAWSASLGFDQQLRRAALEQAEASGRLATSHALQLSAPVSAPLLTLGEVFGAPAHVIASLRALADRLRQRGQEPSEDAMAKQRTRELQDETARRAQHYTQEQRGATAP